MDHIELPIFSCAIVTAPPGADAYAFARRALPGFEAIRAKCLGIELSDDPSSREARTGMMGLLISKVTRLLLSGRPVAVDASGLREDQLNQLARQAGRAFAVPVRVLAPAAGTPDPKILWTRSATDRSEDRGPFDVIGDVHGCLDELLHLVVALGYRVENSDGAGGRGYAVSHPQGRRLVFVGDLADRGPDPVGTVAFARDAHASGAALGVIGNHDAKLLIHLSGGRVSMNHGFPETAAAVGAETADWRARALSFLSGLPSHLVLDEGALVVAHAGCPEFLQGKDSDAVRSFCMYGLKTGLVDAWGRPVRGDWAADYRGRALVVHGHTPVPAPLWGGGGKVLCIDTGCCFGGALTAWRWPERQLVSVPAMRAYAERETESFPARDPTI